MTTVCTCNPGVHWIRLRCSHSGSQCDVRLPTAWLLCQLVDGSARAPTTDVPSCDKPEEAARRRRTRDLRMGIPLTIALRNGERRELKHLSTGRKRNRKR